MEHSQRARAITVSDSKSLIGPNNFWTRPPVPGNVQMISYSLTPRHELASRSVCPSRKGSRTNWWTTSSRTAHSRFVRTVSNSNPIGLRSRTGTAHRIAVTASPASIFIRYQSDGARRGAGAESGITRRRRTLGNRVALPLSSRSGARVVAFRWFLPLSSARTRRGIGSSCDPPPRSENFDQKICAAIRVGRSID